MTSALNVRYPSLFLSLCLAAIPLGAADNPLDQVEKVATEWVKTRAETVRLETEWSSQRALAESLVDALEQRARMAEEEKENAKAKTAQEREELTTLAAKNASTAAGLQTSEVRLKELSERVIALRPFLPPRLSSALALSYQSLAEAENPIGDRMQYVMVILNRCLQFNRIVTVGEEELKLEAAPRSLEVIYWGLSHGYALDRAAGKVWLGSPGAQGWQWEATSGAAEEVARLIAIANDKADPSFVLVPAKLTPSNIHQP